MKQKERLITLKARHPHADYISKLENYLASDRRDDRVHVLSPLLWAYKPSITIPATLIALSSAQVSEHAYSPLRNHINLYVKFS